MRLGSIGFALLALVSATGCSVSAGDPAPPPGDPLPPPSAAPAEEARTPVVSSPKAPASPPATKETNETNADETFAEVVFVLMRTADFELWFCTGTLVAPDTVVTAAHCLEPTKFVSYRIVAPLAPNAPRVDAKNPRSFGGDYAMVENPDIGVLTLDTPIALPKYAQLTDVVSRVESGEALKVTAIVRTYQVPEAPLVQSAVMPLSSTVPYGYVHGFGTPYFSKGGDSGAGLFLVENGKPTHKLVGVARQPEPDRELDHFTRVDAPFLQWYAGLSD